MKKIILTSIFGLFLALVNISMAQVNPNYKEQASAKKEKTEATVIYSLSSDSYQAAHNYKHATSLDKGVVLTSNQPATVPSCCTSVKANVNADYKHPFFQNGEANCDMGYVCKEKAKGACCN